MAHLPAMRGVVLALLVALSPAVAVATVLEGRVRVIDADTVEINGITVRLHGIDAPERGAACRSGPQDCYRVANRRVEALVAGQVLRCYDLGERSYNRIVAHCTLHGRDIAEVLLEEGIVMACPHFARQHPHSRAYMEIEARARQAALGLFEGGQFPPRARFCGGDAPAIAVGGCAIKGNISANGHIYHMPGQRDYEAVSINTARGERWFCTPAEAEAAGWRPARR